MSVTRLTLALIVGCAGHLPARADQPVDASTLFREALTLAGAGDASAARAAYERVLELEPDHRAARRALGYERWEGRWLTQAQAAERAAAASAELQAPAPTAARASRPVAATSAWVKRILAEPEGAVRARALDAAKRLGVVGLKDALIRALASSTDATRPRAAQALGLLGDMSAMGALVAHWEARSGNFSRVYLAQSRQLSYIQDFDVEVASTSFIADPIVGVLQQGVVHSFRILDAVHSFSTVERTAVHGALVRLAGSDLGRDVQPWAAWLRERQRLHDDARPPGN